jgi:ADP-heptose:LPS heptosyltransferase
VKKVLLDLTQCNGLGDLICATPTIKKLYEFYEQQITVLSQMPEIFKNNPHVEASYKSSSVNMDYFMSNYIVHDSFYNVGKKNALGIEYKHNMMDIRQFHAIQLGFMLGQDEMECFYQPTAPNRFDYLEKYVVIHPVQTWATRTWSAANWMRLTKELNERGVHVISIGKDSSETGFFNIDKPTFNFEIELGENLINKTNVADCWHIINNASAVVTMDSGILHLAGTTDTTIVHLGSHIKPEFRAPYRHGSQKYKYHYVRGGCGIECGSNAKYGVKEWGDIQGVAPLINCLENKDTFECHPSVHSVFDKVFNFLQCS